MKTLAVRNCFFISFYRKFLLPEVSICYYFLARHQHRASIFKFISFCYSCTYEDVCCNKRNVKLIQLSILDHALSICNVCNRCLLSFPFEIEMAEEQEYLRVNVLVEWYEIASASVDSIRVYSFSSLM